jgi:translation initiation factor 3 subunit B
MSPAAEEAIDDDLAAEAEELDGYFSDAPLDPQPVYPKLDERLDAAIVITNLPKVPESKVEKLSKVVLKLVSKIGPLQQVSEEEGFSGVMIPTSPDGTTLGFCFVEYETPESAKNAVEVLQDYKFDKNHALAVTYYERARHLQQIDTTSFREPEPAPFLEKPNACEWLEDPEQRDEFLLRHGKETEIMWFDGKNDPIMDYDGAREKEAGAVFCEYYCHWSPAGSYLATLVPPRGVILWSGKNYEKTGRFPARTYTILI